MGTSLSKEISLDKIFMISVSTEMSQIVEKMPYFAMLKNPSKNS